MYLNTLHKNAGCAADAAHPISYAVHRSQEGYMSSLDTIKKKIQKLFATDPNIHVNVSINKPRIRLINEPAVIKGVYPHIFQIEEYSSGAAVCQSIQYNALLTGQVEIIELKAQSPSRQLKVEGEK